MLYETTKSALYIYYTPFIVGAMSILLKSAVHESDVRSTSAQFSIANVA